MLNQSIINTYSRVHVPIEYTNNGEISFEGSQKQIEFFSAWDKVLKFYNNKDIKELSFLEIGAWKGLWGIAFSEFCKLKDIKGSYTTLTMMDQDSNNQPLLRTIRYLNSINIESHLIDLNTLNEQALPEVLKVKKKYNIVFIDASHVYEDVMSDIKKFSPLATELLVFHDIRPKSTNPSFGVYQALIDSNIELDEEIVSDEGTMGIGIKYVI